MMGIWVMSIDMQAYLNITHNPITILQSHDDVHGMVRMMYHHSPITLTYHHSHMCVYMYTHMSTPMTI